MEDWGQGPGTGGRIRTAVAGKFLALPLGRKATKGELEGGPFPGPQSPVPGPG
jgi:hypothetical protein